MKVNLTDLEKESYNHFKESCCRVNSWLEIPADQMGFQLIVLDSNGIGQVVIAYCEALDAKLDITDMGSW